MNVTVTAQDYRYEAARYAGYSLRLVKSGRKFSGSIASTISVDLERVADLVDALNEADDITNLGNI